MIASFGCLLAIGPALYALFNQKNLCRNIDTRAQAFEGLRNGTLNMQFRKKYLVSLLYYVDLDLNKLSYPSVIQLCAAA